MMSISISPAYGRDYRSKDAALQDWLAGKDFKIESGNYVGGYLSIRDTRAMRADGYTSVSLRYGKLRKQMIIHL